MNYRLALNTVKYLKPSQVYWLVRNRFRNKERTYFGTLPCGTREVEIAIPELDCDERIWKRFMPEEMAKGMVCLLGQMVNLNYHTNYTRTLKPLIYNNLYYFEYGVALGGLYQKTLNKAYWELFKKLYFDYLEAMAGVKSAYTMALHIPNVLIALDLFGETVEDGVRKKIYCELYSQYHYLQGHQEKHLMANHYFEDLKALIIGSYLFRDDTRLKKYMEDFRKQCEEQVLADGVHFELSLMYHKLILEDLMRIAMLTKQPGFPKCDWLMPLIQKMTDAACSLERGIGRTPLFNDAGDNVAKLCDQLRAAAKNRLGINTVLKDSFETSGYYMLYDENRTLIFDVGRIGVDYQPAHGHCDCLSFELSHRGKPLFVNQGTFEYQGVKRKVFRKTSAHNTITMDDNEQSECWGEFRVAKRISEVRVLLDGNKLVGSYRNTKGQRHERSVVLTERMLAVTDSTSGAEKACSFLHIAPGFNVVGSSIYEGSDKIAVIETIHSGMEIVSDGELSWYAPEFGNIQKGTCLLFRWGCDELAHGYVVKFE